MTLRLLVPWSCFCCLLLCSALVTQETLAAIDLAPSQLDLAEVKAHYSLVSVPSGSLPYFAVDEEPAVNIAGEDSGPRLKSPAKAFFLSLVVPGAGQWYYGSRIKPFIFLGAEATAWGLHTSYHSEGEDLTDEFEAFNQEHWIKDRYDSLLVWTYGVNDDEQIDPLTAPEMTHHLPDTRTQQYYEMTGKYDQFSWGWDDATLDGDGFLTYGAENPPPRLFLSDSIPQSPNRFKYETMRNDANNEFDKATRMIYLALTNHLVSAFEAYFMTKFRNNRAEKESGGKEGTTWGKTKERPFWSKLKFKPSLKSMHQKNDTPYLKVTYKF